MAVKIGLEMMLFRNSDGPGSGPTWVEMTNVRDVTLNLEKARADITTRGAAGWRINKATLKDATVEFQMLYNQSDSDYTALSTAFFGDSEVEIAVADNEGNGVRMVAEILNFSRGEPLEEGVTVDVSLAPSDPDDPPEEITGLPTS